jgi:hypothetical protein
VVEKRSSIIALATAGALSLATAVSAAAQPCGDAIQATKAEWLLLTHGNHIAPSQPIITSDGRHLTGVLLNYVGVLVYRAERACAAAGIVEAGSSSPPLAADPPHTPGAEAIAYVQEAEALLHPPAR